MVERSWAQQAIDKFFETRESPTQSECDDDARRISGGSAVQPVAVPDSLSYTVICTGRPGKRRDLIVSFRESKSTLDQGVVKLAKSIHGVLVPEAAYHGKMPGASPPLIIYTMPYLQGTPCLEAFSTESELSPEDEARQECYVKHLARYFARCWLRPQPVHPQLKDSFSILPRTTISELERNVPILFKPTYPQILTHNDLSLFNEKTFEITGIVDWSLARVLPFGMELDSLLLATGYMDLSGWHNYTCRLQLLNAFWDEFWTQCRVYDDVYRQEVRTVAVQATNIGIVLHYAFQRNADGSPSEELTTSKWALETLNALLMDKSIQRQDTNPNID
ncbi:hypothetical protein BJX99DRAFT_266381 [Aspergillus californicus]